MQSERCFAGHRGVPSLHGPSLSSSQRAGEAGQELELAIFGLLLLRNAFDDVLRHLVVGSAGTSCCSFPAVTRRERRAARVSMGRTGSLPRHSSRASSGAEVQRMPSPLPAVVAKAVAAAATTAATMIVEAATATPAKVTDGRGAKFTDGRVAVRNSAYWLRWRERLQHVLPPKGCTAGYQKRSRLMRRLLSCSFDVQVLPPPATPPMLR